MVNRKWISSYQNWAIRIKKKIMSPVLIYRYGIFKDLKIFENPAVFSIQLVFSAPLDFGHSRNEKKISNSITKIILKIFLFYFVD